MAAGISREQGLAVWQRIATGEASARDLECMAVARFAGIVTPALAAHLLGETAVATAVGADALMQSRLVNRFNAAAQRAALADVVTSGVDCVVIKGFAAAHSLYSSPELRTIGDLDLLVRAVDRDRLIALLAGKGWAFRPLPRPPWGFISTASYMPFVSPDGAVNLDIHVHPDCWPAYRSLTTDTVFAAARAVASDGLAFRIPSDTHALVLCATNTAKDKFSAFAARKIVDALLLLRRGEVDLATAAGLAEAGGFALPNRAFLALLHALGAGLANTHAAAHLPTRVRGEFARVLDDTITLYPAEPGLLATLRREVTVCTEPSVGLGNALRRLTGLVRPGTGVPEVDAAPKGSPG